MFVVSKMSKMSKADGFHFFTIILSFVSDSESPLQAAADFYSGQAPRDTCTTAEGVMCACTSHQRSHTHCEDYTLTLNPDQSDSSFNLLTTPSLRS